jgi:Restriction endonuclease/Topoisomerase DNA binding C4 zinc finger
MAATNKCLARSNKSRRGLRRLREVKSHNRADPWELWWSRANLMDNTMAAVIGMAVLTAGIGLVIAALVGAVRFIASILLPRKWQANREPCPHGIKGGLRLEKCARCVEAKRREDDAEIEQARIRLAAEELQRSEAARLSNSIIPSLADLRRLSPQRFEDEVARLFERLGYDVQQTRYSNDYGRDAILHKDGKKYLLECKRYGGTRTSGRPELQKFHAAIIDDKAVSGFFVTTGMFTVDAKQYAKKLGIITLIDGKELLLYLTRGKQPNSNDDRYWVMCLNCGAKVAHSIRSAKPISCPKGHLVEPTLDIDGLLGNAPTGATPRCERCGKPMKLINGKKGRFWGCSQYPQCHSSRPWRP